MTEDLCDAWLRPSEKQPACLGNVPGSSTWDIQTNDEEQLNTSCNSRWTYFPTVALYVRLNVPFKTKMRDFWCKWMVSGEKENTVGGNLKSPSFSLITQSIHKAWQSIPTNAVANSFKKCGISKSMDDTEDDSLYSDLVGSPKKDTDEIEDWRWLSLWQSPCQSYSWNCSLVRSIIWKNIWILIFLCMKIIRCLPTSLLN